MSALGTIIYLAVVILAIAGFWMVFTKADRPGWGAIIPIYSFYLMCKVAGRPGWWWVLLFIPIVNIVIWFIVAIDVAKSFRQGTGFGVGLALLSFVTTLLIAGGIVFELPVVMLSLSRLGIADTRTFTRHRRFAIIIMTVIAAVLPGGDAVSMLMLLGAEVVLYEVGIMACRAFGAPTLRAQLGELT